MTVRPTTGDAYREWGPPAEPIEPRVVDGAQLAGERTVDCDVCVIGTGAGGAPVAKELAEGGMRVVMLEEGRHFTTDDFTTRPREMSTILYRDAAQVVTVGNTPIVLPLGMGVGGTTMINSGTCFRTPEPVLEMWGERFGLEELSADELDPYFRRVERELNVVQVPEDRAGRNALVVKRGAEALGWSGDFIWRNVRGCVGSGVCSFGCPTSAKQQTALSYVPHAWAAGATTYTQCRAERVEHDGRRAQAVVARAAGGGRVRVTCAHVVVACGAIHTPLFLARQGIGGRSGELGRNLAIHPATGVRALFDEEIEMAKGVPQSYFIDEFADEGIMFEGAAGPPDYAAMSFPFSGEKHRELMLSFSRISQFGLMVSDLSRGFVRERAGRVEIRYDLNREDTATFRRGIELLCELYVAAGARVIYPPVTGVAELTDGDLEPLRRHEVRAADLVLMAFHPLGTARADARPDHGVVDAGLRVHGMENVWVADASVIPSSLGVNPQITIMALATRLAYSLLDKPAPDDEPEPESIARPRITRPHALTA
ncbi:MAG TPA: GMC family oxidoreductase [Thermoleophilaceae bacterium]|nr:GMC family oxidoreductase [Thermoleophilaceae bacterium]